MMPGQPLHYLDLDLRSHIRSIPDFPKPGILFRDINPLLRSPEAMAEVIRQLGEFCDQVKPDLIVGSNRGGSSSGTLGQRPTAWLRACAEAGKLPGEVVGLDYALDPAPIGSRSKPMLLTTHPGSWWWTICWPPVERLQQRDNWSSRPVVVVGFAFVIELEGSEAVRLCRRAARGRAGELRLAFLPVEDVFQLLQTQQPEAPQHDREGACSSSAWRCPSSRALDSTPNAVEELQQRLGWWGLPLAGHHHGGDRGCGQFGNARQSCIGPSLMARRLSRRKAEICFSSSSARRRRGSSNGWRLEKTRTSRSVAKPTWSTSSQRLMA